MPTTTSRNLSIIVENGDTAWIKVNYIAVFNDLEHFLCGQGLKFRERIEVIGIDKADSSKNIVLHRFPDELIKVPVGEGSVLVARERQIKVLRSSLQKAPGKDQIQCGINIELVDYLNQVSNNLTNTVKP